MSSPTRVLFWAEGPTDRAAAKALIVAVGAEPGPDYSKRHKSASGKDRLDDKLAAYNAAAEYEPFLVLRDLDKDADCAPTLVQKKLPARSKFICFRVVVRSIEAWLMADARAFAEWVQVNQMQVPVAPEELENPKDQLLALVRRSRSREVKSDLLPAYGVWSPHRTFVRCSVTGIHRKILGCASRGQIGAGAIAHASPGLSGASSVKLPRSIRA